MFGIVVAFCFDGEGEESLYIYGSPGLETKVNNGSLCAVFNGHLTTGISTLLVTPSELVPDGSMLSMIAYCT